MIRLKNYELHFCKGGKRTIYWNLNTSMSSPCKLVRIEVPDLYFLKPDWTSDSNESRFNFYVTSLIGRTFVPAIFPNTLFDQGGRVCTYGTEFESLNLDYLVSWFWSSPFTVTSWGTSLGFPNYPIEYVDKKSPAPIKSHDEESALEYFDRCFTRITDIKKACYFQIDSEYYLKKCLIYNSYYKEPVE